MSDFDAAAAAARATGETPPTSSTSDESDDTVAPDHTDAEGAPSESDMGSTSRWREALQSTEPDPPLDKVESPFNPDEGGPSRFMRGVKKTLGMDGMPAWADIVLSVPEMWVWLRDNHLDNVGPSDQDAGDDRGDDVEDGGGDLPDGLGVDRA